MKDDGRSYTSQLLKEKEAMEIINQILIPALDVVGDKFEKGTIFLPQLILAADVAKECFDERIILQIVEILLNQRERLLLLQLKVTYMTLERIL